LPENSVVNEIQLLIKKSNQERKEGELLLEEGYASGAINRFYYSAYHLAQSILLYFGERPRTHSGLIQRFSLLAIDRKLFDKNIAKIFAELYRNREMSDYSVPDLLDRQDATELYQKYLKYSEVIHTQIQKLIQTE